MSNANIKILLDTNIIIQSEDYCVIENKFSDFLRKCQEYSVSCFINKDISQDINRDKNGTRRDIILSKLNKYPTLLDIAYPSQKILIEKYGNVKKENDLIDIKLLYCLENNAVNFLVTEDIGIHRRVRSKPELTKRVFNVADALDWLDQTFASKSISLPHIINSKCYNIDINQPIFSSLKNDYKGFDTWFKKCQSDHRDCWVIQENNVVIAILIWKEDTGESFKKDIKEDNIDIENQHKALKICTFKVSENVRGGKLGELLLKQCLWYATANKFDWIYVTAFEEKQDYLIEFLQEYGFEKIGLNRNNEVILCKNHTKQNCTLNHLSAFEFHKKFYPQYYDGKEVQKFIIPIKPEFHNKLFPEYSKNAQYELFNNNKDATIAGNTIKKVYVSGTRITTPKVGDLLFFYMSKDEQCITTVGVISEFQKCNNLPQLLELTGKRTVYSKNELNEYLNTSSNKELTVIDFYIAGHITDHNGNSFKLSDTGISIPQSIAKIKDNDYQSFKEKMAIIYGK